MDRLALGLDVAMFLVILVALVLDNAWLGAAGLLLLLVLLALPVGPSEGLPSQRTLALVGILLFALVFALAVFALRETGARFELSRGALPLLAVLAASAGLVGLVWVALWRAVAARPAPWKPAAFGFCLFVFLWSPALFVALGDVEDPAIPRPVLALSAAALAVAAALPFVDSVFRRGDGRRSTTR
jgi:hypothetical protein